MSNNTINSKKIHNKKLSQWINQAVKDHQAGQLSAAKAQYLKILQHAEANPEINHLLGLVCLQLKELNDSVHYLQRAVQLNPKEMSFTQSLVNVWVQVGEFAKAKQLLQQLVQENRINAELADNLGFCLIQLGEYSAAIDWLKSRLNIDAKNWQTWLLLGNSYFQMQQFSEAAECYQQVLHLSPHQIDAMNNLASIHLNQQLNTQALELLCQVVELNPQHFIAWSNMASALIAIKQYDEALNCSEKSIQINAHYSDAYLLSGICNSALGRFEQALARFQWLLSHQHVSPNFFNHLGNLYKRMQIFEQAEAAFNSAIELDEHCIEAIYNLGILKALQRNYSAAIEYFKKTLILDKEFHAARAPLLHMLRQVCRWDEAQEQVTICRQLLANHVAVELPPFSFITLEDSDASEQLAIANHWFKQHAQTIIPLPAKGSSNGETQPQVLIKQRLINELSKKQTSHQKIKLGYLSADFHEHATASLLVRVIELHDRHQFEVHAFSYGVDDHSNMRKRLLNAFDFFHDVQYFNDKQVAQLIQNQHIDLLIDLKGFTQNSRSQILAYRPAPIQIAYLGYPATMGKKLVDFAVADRFITQSQSAQFEESMLNLNYCYQPNDDTRHLASKPSHFDYGLPLNHIIFGAFHQSYKLSKEMLQTWSQILINVPESIFWCLSVDVAAQAVIKSVFIESGVDEGRIIFAPRCSPAEHLARIQLVDIMLDAFPVNGHTTTSDALWAGVPVITLVGKTFISRVAGSLLHFMQLDELITENHQAYQQRAITIARSPEKLQAIKQKIQVQKKSSPVFNTQAYTTDFEKQLLNIYHSHHQIKNIEE
ncbi:tetratricopeptide repeat protein [Aliikangiella maris]|uniref:protein O-GlcNAc transferase n=2 Tax=Aliikangiella maris TaxID=3162458 RepID=A0ABV3MMG3_9GAMM